MIAICTPVVRVVPRVALALAVLGIATAAFADPEGAASGNVVRAPRAPNVGPLTNSVVGNARLLVPDGTSVLGDFASDTQRWYAVGIEPGKTYVIDAMDPYSDNAVGSVYTLAVYDSDGTSAPPETSVNCNTVDLAPGFGLAAGYNGERCIVRADPPSPTNVKDKRAIYIGLGLYLGAAGRQFQIRVRESTIYSRWTTNGVDFHVELQNTASDQICAEVDLYPDTGTAYNGAAPQPYILTVPAYGAKKVVIANGTAIGGAKRGTLRVGACAFPATLNVGTLHVNTYAFNPAINQYLVFTPWSANGGANANSF